MTKSGLAESPATYFDAVLSAALRFPGVRIDREAYLRAALSRRCPEEQIRKAIEETPAAAGISVKVLDKAADDSIKYETAKVTLISAAAGFPGGFAMFGTVPADAAQNFAHMLRIAQKLAYLYSWPELFSDDRDEVDDATKGVLTLFVGVMFGVQAANAGVVKVAAKVSEQVLLRLPKKALTKGIIYPIVKKVAVKSGEKMTKEIFARGVSKAVPVVGALMSGGFTWAGYLSMCSRLKKHLSSLELTNTHADSVQSS